MATATALGVLVTVLTAAVVSVRQAQIAREQTTVARQEAQTSAAVQDFLQSLFQNNSVDQDDPVASRNKTATQLLDEGAARIGKSLDDQPKAKVRILGILVDLYEQMARPKRRRRSRRNAKACDATMSPDRISALVVLAEARAALGDAPGASAATAEARAIRGRHPSLGPQYPALASIR